MIGIDLQKLYPYWWVGFVVGLILAVFQCWRQPRGLIDDTQRNPWNLPQAASSHERVNGVLAGFTIVILAALLTLYKEEATSTPAFSVLDRDKLITAMVMFLLSFLCFVGGAIIYSMVPAEHVEVCGRFAGIDRLTFTLASDVYYVSVLLSFSAFIPLIVPIVEEYAPEWVFRWMSPALLHTAIVLVAYAPISATSVVVMQFKKFFGISLFLTGFFAALGLHSYLWYHFMPPVWHLVGVSFFILVLVMFIFSTCSVCVVWPNCFRGPRLRVGLALAFRVLTVILVSYLSLSIWRFLTN